MNYDALIVGAGITGATLAERCSNELGWRVLLIDRRDHIGGNVYDYIDPETNIRVSQYGAHIFHTNDDDVWNYINRFSEWVRWDHKVLASVDDKLVPIPVNIETVNSLLNCHLTNDNEMQKWLEQHQIKCEIPMNSRDISLSRVGEHLHEKLIHHYTYKQWNKYPEDLDASVLARIPVRMNNDPRYFTDKYQVLPKNGYTEFVWNMVRNPLIDIKLNTTFENLSKEISYKHLIYTGPIDSYFHNSGLPKLEYRSINFHKEVIDSCGFFQPVSVVNYPMPDCEFTRIVEYKHFLNQSSAKTVIVKETTTDEGDPYYPVPNRRNQELYLEYKKLAEKEEKEKNVIFVGRLASYKYFNMDQAIRVALDIFSQLKAKNAA